MPFSKEAPTNQNLVLQVLLELLGKQNEQSKPLLEDFAEAIQRFKECFVLYNQQHPADNLLDVLPQTQNCEESDAMEVAASGSASSQFPELNQDGPSRIPADPDTQTTEQISSINMTTDDQGYLSGSNTPLQSQSAVVMTATVIAAIESELNELTSME